jgi:aspartate/methionine/tyrosine aminotransferase
MRLHQYAHMYESRRNELCDGLNRIGWDVKKPLATMFVWAKIPDKYLNLGSLNLVSCLLNMLKLLYLQAQALVKMEMSMLDFL